MFNFLKIESYKKGIVFSTLFNFISRLLLFLQNVAIAYYFGSKAQTDVFFYCYATITLVSVFVNAMDTSVLIPESMRLSEQEGKAKSMSFLNVFIYGYFILGLLISAIIYLNPVAVFTVISSFDKSILVENQNILLFSIPLFSLMIVTNLLVNILTSYKFFTIPMLAAMVNNVSALVFIIVFHDTIGISSLLMGLVLAYILNLTLLIYLLRSVIGWRFDFKKVHIDGKTIRNMVYAQAGNVTSLMASYVPIYLLSGFGSGVITTLTYGQKTGEIPGQLITNQVSSVAGIKLNESFARRDFETLNRIFLEPTELLLFILTAVSGMMFLFREEIITILYGRGAFDARSVEASVELFKLFVLILPMMVINTMVARLFMAGQKIRESFLYQIVFNFFLLLFVFLGIRNFGVIGYPTALIALHVGNVLFTYFMLRLFFPAIQYYKTVVIFLKIIILNGVVLIGISQLKHWVDPVNEFFSIAVCGAVYVSFILLLNRLLKISTVVSRVVTQIMERLPRGGRG